MRTVYIDESGRAGDTEFVGMGACDADPKDWEEFEKRWRIVLEENNAPYLHMKEFAGCRDAFKGWTELQRRKLMSDCLYTLVDTEIIMMSAVVRSSDFDRLLPSTREALGDPYFCCFQECLYGSALAGYLESDGEKVDVVYSQQDEFKGRFSAIFEGWKDYYSAGAGSNLGHLSFADMRSNPGLQLADLLAYESTHYHHLKSKRPDLKPRVPFKVLADHQLSMGAGMFKFIPHWMLQMKYESPYWMQIQDIMWSDLDTYGGMLLQTCAEPVMNLARLRRMAAIRNANIDPRQIKTLLPKRLSGVPTVAIPG